MSLGLSNESENKMKYVKYKLSSYTPSDVDDQIIKEGHQSLLIRGQRF